MAEGGYVRRRTGILFGTCKLDTERNILTKFKKIRPLVLEEMR